MKATSTDKRDHLETVSLRRTVYLFRRIILPHLGGYRWKLAAGGALMVVLVLLQLPMPLVTRYVIDDVFPSKDLSVLVLVVIGLAGITLINAASGVANRYLLTVARQHIVRDIELFLFRHVQQLPVTFFDNVTPGRLLSRIGNDVSGVSGLLGDTIVTFLVDFMTLGMGVVVIVLFHWKLALMSLALLPFYVLSLVAFRGPLQSCGHEMEEKIGLTTSALWESLDGIRLTKAYQLQQTQVERLGARLDDSASAFIKYASLSSLSGSITGVIGSCAPLIVFIYGGYEIMHQHMTLGTLVAFNAFLGYAFGPTQRIFTMQEQVQMAAAALERMEQMLRMKGEEMSAPIARTAPAPTGSVEFKDVSFAYRVHSPVLRGISLRVDPGEKVAIVGPSGAGKTTLMHLLLRFYEPQQGTINIGGVNIADMALEDLRNLITVVPQNAYVLSGTVEDNIRCGRLDATWEEIQEAARLAQVHNFIVRLPDGYDTEVGPRGVKLSGGEKQRLAIARALLRKPGILILDEAMSEIDAESERLIQEAMMPLIRGRTTLLIAHRYSSVRMVDQIVVMDDGRIMAKGTHTQLYENNGIYRQFCDLQTLAI